MQTIACFDWRKLTGMSVIEHAFNGSQILVRPAGVDQDVEPFELSDWGSTYTWVKNDDDFWVLRTTGAPTTMTKLSACFGEFASDAVGIDERVVLTTIACESGPDHTHPSGRSLKSPRTELGYPSRTGERDPGDEARDEIDWNLTKGMKSSHGLMQTLIGTAHRSAPALFSGVPVSKFREVLWDPKNSIAAGTAFMRYFPGPHLSDPVALRFHYAAGGVYPAHDNRWGARMYEYMGKPMEGPCILAWVAFWNDLAEVMGDAT